MNSLDIKKSFGDAKSDVSIMKSEAKGVTNGTFDLTKVKKIIVVFDAGMGSSAMGVGILRKKIQNVNLNITVTNLAINNLPPDADIIITHKYLTQHAKQYAPNAHHISLNNFLNSDIYSQLVAELVASHGGSRKVNPTVNDNALENKPLFKLSEKNIFLGLTAQSKVEAIRAAGQKSIDNGYVKPAYIESMLEREALTSTYLGESIAVPHGTIEAKDSVINTGIVFCQYPSSVQFSEDADDNAKIVIGITACNNEHLDVIAKLTNTLNNQEVITILGSTQSIK